MRRSLRNSRMLKLIIKILITIAILFVIARNIDLSAVLGARAQVLEARLRLIDLQTQRDGVTTRLNSLIAD